nr:hypothetical protein [Anaerolineae bacterium]
MMRWLLRHTPGPVLWVGDMSTAYPYALIEDGTHGLALAISLDSPRLVKLAYDQEQGRYEARGYLGISPLATRLAGRADLSLELYRVDPTWGFRAASARPTAWRATERPRR